MSTTDTQEYRTGQKSPTGPARRANVRVTPSSSDYPRSHAANYTRPAATTPEQDLIENLKHEWKRQHGNEPTPQTSRQRRETIIADVHNFEIYRCPETDPKRPSELTSLHLFDVKAKKLCFDGYVRVGEAQYYVERIQIDNISIEGYGSHIDPDIVTYIQTRLARKDAASDIWLRLRQPAARYKRFHSPFLWVAVLGKHALDYMDEQPKNTVSLESFKVDFFHWLAQRFGSSKVFEKWHTLFGNVCDFRVAFNAYAEYFYVQACNLSTRHHLTSHPVWAHCNADRMTAIERQPNRVKDTLTTSQVFDSFQQMYFARKLKQITPSTGIQKTQKKRRTKLGFAEDRITPTASKRNVGMARGKHDVRVGDVVSISPDEVDKINWRKSGDEWLAYVQGVEPDKGGAQRLSVLWLYRAIDTNMCLAKYVLADELFLSDNCNCGERKTLSTDVIRKHSVEWSPRSLNTTSNYFVRQTYITQDSAFVTVKEEHKTCSCRNPTPSVTHWSAGDTVYITKTTGGQKRLEPVVIHEVDYSKKEVKVRVLLRLQRDCSKLALQAGRRNIAPNELVLTGKLKALPIARIQRAFHVIFVQKTKLLANDIPSPYDLQGAGDHWFVSMGLDSADGNQQLVWLNGLPKGFCEAQVKPLPFKKLRGLSLFSGGGGLDRGLEEGGAIEFQTSVDYDSAAIHTQRANCQDPQNMRLFCGSVDDYLKVLLSGGTHRSVARVGEVDVIVAGSPCPGFSTLQRDMFSEQSLTNASHITTFCTAVDVYRPLYGILENVVNMASTRAGLEEQNVLSQLVACLVSMGYQVNQYIMDSWTYGSCQQRSRIILTIAAPGLEPILQRPHTHSRSYVDTKARSLGKLPNGERFGDREHYATPFPHVTAEASTSDLPNIGNGNVQTCIRFPDHRLSLNVFSKVRALLECIPRDPPGCSYTKALQLGLIPSSLQLTKKETTRSYTRIKATDLIPTITTMINMQDARNSASVHWSEHRPLSIQDAKRTQGYKDHEAIIGTLSEQWKILGNGVDRKVSFAIGLALRDALTKSKRPGRSDEALEDESEFVVDIEEDLVVQLSDSNEHHQDMDRKARSASSDSSSSTDSFSSTCETRQHFDLALSLKGACDLKPPQKKPSLTFPPEESIEAESRFGPTEGSLSRSSHTSSSNPGRLPLPSVPTFALSALQQLPKRQRTDFEVGVQERLAAELGPLKRLKTAEVRHTTSPARVEPEVVIKLEDRRASMPPLSRLNRTRRIGPPEFAPKAWHKKIEAHNNVIDLTQE